MDELSPMFDFILGMGPLKGSIWGHLANLGDMFDLPSSPPPPRGFGGHAPGFLGERVRPTEFFLVSESPRIQPGFEVLELGGLKVGSMTREEFQAGLTSIG